MTDQQTIGALQKIGAAHIVTGIAMAGSSTESPNRGVADSGGHSGFQSVFIPVLLDMVPNMALRGHVARANEWWRLLDDWQPALAIFAGADTYVSPSWYPSKAEHGKVVPTWNYQVIHLHGSVRAVDNAQFVAQVVRDLTDLHESPLPAPWSVDDAPATFLESMHRAIVGIEFRVDRIEAKSKLSQNRNDADRIATANVLAAGTPGQQLVAAVMTES